MFIFIPKLQNVLIAPRIIVLFCSIAVLDPTAGHTMDVLSPFVPVLCHSHRLFHGQSCPRLDVVHPGRAWPSSPACTWHCSLHYLFLQATLLNYSTVRKIRPRQSLSTDRSKRGFSSFRSSMISRSVAVADSAGSPPSTAITLSQ